MTPYEQAIAEAGISDREARRWMELAAIPDELFERILANVDAQELSVSYVLKQAKSNGLYSSERGDWATPQDLFDLLNEEFEFDLDVCAMPWSAKCAHYFAPDEDGLSQIWTGRCFMNPPYGREIGDWVSKAFESAQRDAELVVCLVPARVDTEWWWSYCRFGEIRFLRGRLHFDDGDDAAPFPSAVVIFRKNFAPGVVWWEAWHG